MMRFLLLSKKSFSDKWIVSLLGIKTRVHKVAHTWKLHKKTHGMRFLWKVSCQCFFYCMAFHIKVWVDTLGLATCQIAVWAWWVQVCSFTLTFGWLHPPTHTDTVAHSSLQQLCPWTLMPIISAAHRAWATGSLKRGPKPKSWAWEMSEPPQQPGAVVKTDNSTEQQARSFDGLDSILCISIWADPWPSWEKSLDF